ncbi:hypothetical protein [Ruminococcus sp.]
MRTVFRKKRQYLERLICVVLSIFMIFTLPNVYYISHENLFSIAAAACEGMALIYLFGKNRKHIKLNFVFWITLYLILALIYYAFNMKSFGCLKILIVFLPFCICFFHFVKAEKFADIYVKIAIAFSLVFLISWLAVATGFLHASSAFMMEWGDGVKVLRYHPLYFNAQRGRNTAIFTEGPVANYFFSVSMLMNEFIRKKDQCTILFHVIFAVSIISTGTTTGLLFLLFFVVYFLYFHYGRNTAHAKLYKRLMLFALPVVAVLLVCLVKVFLESKLETKSGMVRLLMMTREIEAFFHNVLIGNGFSSYSDGSSNSITSLLADGGILLWSLFYYPIIANVIRGLKRRSWECLFCLLFLSVFIVSVFQYTLLTCVILGILYNKLIETSNVKVVL